MVRHHLGRSVFAVLITLACVGKEPAAPPPPPPPPPERHDPAPATVALPTPIETKPVPPATSAVPPVEAKPAAAVPNPPTVSTAKTIVDPGGPMAVADTKPGLTRIGASKCGVCHKVQFASWSSSAHARRQPPMDCEDCHGAGSEYKKLSIMKDPKQAEAAGLVVASREFCSQCHKSDWSDDMLEKAHAHKSEGAGAAGSN